MQAQKNQTGTLQESYTSFLDILSDAELVAFLAAARGEGLRPLVEVHDTAELERALDAGADLVGVNNRNLVTLLGASFSCRQSQTHREMGTESHGSH